MKIKNVWILVVAEMLAGAGCRFVESTVEQQAALEQPPAASRGEVKAGPPPALLPESEPATRPSTSTPGPEESQEAVSSTPPPETPEATSPPPPPTPAAEAEAVPSEARQGPPEPAATPERTASQPSKEGPEKPAAAVKPGTSHPALKAEAEPTGKPTSEPSPELMKKLAEQLAEAQAAAMKEAPGGGGTPQSEQPATQPPKRPIPAGPSPAKAAPPEETPTPSEKTGKEEREPSEHKVAQAPRTAQKAQLPRKTTAPEESPEPSQESEREGLPKAGPAPDQEALEAEQQAWEKAENERKTQRQAAFAAIKLHLSRAEDALDGRKNGLQEALAALQQMRRSLSFLRTGLTPVALWHHLDCARALLQDHQIDAAQEQLEAALALAPMETPAEQEAATPPSNEVGNAGRETPAAEPTASSLEASRASGEAEQAAEENEPAKPDLRARLAKLRDAFHEDNPEDIQQTLEELLSEVPLSAEEALLDNLEAEIDYASEALARGSRKAAEMELGSIRENADKLAQLVVGEPLSEEIPGEPQAQEPSADREEQTLPKEGSEGEEPAPRSSESGSATVSPRTQHTSRLPAAALVGGLAIGVLVWSRTRRPRL